MPAQACHRLVGVKHRDGRRNDLTVGIVAGIVDSAVATDIGRAMPELEIKNGRRCVARLIIESLVSI